MHLTLSHIRIPQVYSHYLSSVPQSVRLKRIRLFIGDMPRLLRDILKDVVQEQPDMDVVGCGGHAELLAAFERQNVDVVLLGQTVGDIAAAMRQLLTVRPGLKVIIVPNDGRFAVVFELRRLVMTEPSPQMLVHAIRSLPLMS